MSYIIMVRGSRHSKNAGTMGFEVITYAENRALGYGTVLERLEKDSIANICDCRLTLQPALDPVCTPYGIIFSREAILKCLLKQRQKIKRKMQVWLNLQQETKFEKDECLALENESQLIEFEAKDIFSDNRITRKIDSGLTKKTWARNKKVLIYGNVGISSGTHMTKKSFWVDDETTLEKSKKIFLRLI